MSLVAYQRTNVPFAIFDGEVKAMEKGNIWFYIIYIIYNIIYII